MSDLLETGVGSLELEDRDFSRLARRAFGSSVGQLRATVATFDVDTALDGPAEGHPYGV